MLDIYKKKIKSIICDMIYILQHINQMFIEPRWRWHVSCLLWQGISKMQNIDADALPLMCSMVFCHILYSLYVLIYDSYSLECFLWVLRCNSNLNATTKWTWWRMAFLSTTRVGCMHVRVSVSVRVRRSGLRESYLQE